MFVNHGATSFDTTTPGISNGPTAFDENSTSARKPRTKGASNENPMARSFGKQLDSNSTTPAPKIAKRRAFGDISNRKGRRDASNSKQLLSVPKKTVSFQTPARKSSAGNNTTGSKLNRQALTLTPSRKVEFILPQRTKILGSGVPASDGGKLASKQKTIPRSVAFVEECGIEDVEFPAGRQWGDERDESDSEFSIEDYDTWRKDMKTMAETQIELYRQEQQDKLRKAELALSNHKENMWIRDREEFTDPMDDLIDSNIGLDEDLLFNGATDGILEFANNISFG